MVIGENVFIGSGAMLKDRINVGDFSVVALGSVVLESVEENTTVMGSPARITNEGAQGLLYAPSRKLKEDTEEVKPEAAAALAGTEKLTEGRIAELYWEAFFRLLRAYGL